MVWKEQAVWSPTTTQDSKQPTPSSFSEVTSADQKQGLYWVREPKVMGGANTYYSLPFV